MSIEQMCVLPVASIMHEDSILWMWTTNAFMRHAYTVLDAWGFKDKTILTWDKGRFGTGDYLHGQTEHCIMAVRGKPTVELTNQTTLLRAPAREHSPKPTKSGMLNPCAWTRCLRGQACRHAGIRRRRHRAPANIENSRF